jgi:hypothetical protein
MGAHSRIAVVALDGLILAFAGLGVAAVRRASILVVAPLR